jgi:hypothetical protein
MSKILIEMTPEEYESHKSANELIRGLVEKIQETPRVFVETEQGSEELSLTFATGESTDRNKSLLDFLNENLTWVQDPSENFNPYAEMLVVMRRGTFDEKFNEAKEFKKSFFFQLFKFFS